MINLKTITNNFLESIIKILKVEITIDFQVDLMNHLTMKGDIVMPKKEQVTMQDIEILKRRLSALEKKILQGNQNKEETKKVSSSEGTNRIIVPIELEKGVELPFYVHPTDAGFDLRANRDYYIAPGQTLLIKTGIKMAIPKGYELQIRARSGISLKTDIRLANGVGTVDSAYRGDIGIIFHNTYRFNNMKARCIDLKGNPVQAPKGYPKLTVYIQKGDRIAQGVLSKVYHADFKIVSSVADIGEDRGGGFGHSSI